MNLVLYRISHWKNVFISTLFLKILANFLCVFFFSFACLINLITDQSWTKNSDCVLINNKNLNFKRALSFFFQKILSKFNELKIEIELSAWYCIKKRKKEMEFYLILNWIYEAFFVLQLAKMNYQLCKTFILFQV